MSVHSVHPQVSDVLNEMFLVVWKSEMVVQIQNTSGSTPDLALSHVRVLVHVFYHVY